MRLLVMAVLLTSMSLPIKAAPLAPSAPSAPQKPVPAPAAKSPARADLPKEASTPVSGVNNSRTPTEIQIIVPGQPSYTTVIPPAPAGQKKIPVTGDEGTPSCTTMKAPYRAGLWEITSVSNNSLMPQPITARIKRCVTVRDAQNACGLNQATGGRNRDCRITDMQVSGNIASWTMHCESSQFSGQGNGHSTFSADAYEGKFEMNASMNGMSMQMSTTFAGKRLGNCR